jgi:hypothetical protein
MDGRIYLILVTNLSVQMYRQPFSELRRKFMNEIASWVLAAYTS